MAALGFSTFVAPCATTTCWSCGESTPGGAKPVAFVFALGTLVSEGPSGGDAATLVVTTAATAAAASSQRIRRFISPFARVDVDGADSSRPHPRNGLRDRWDAVTRRLRKRPLVAMAVRIPEHPRGSHAQLIATH